MSGKKGRSGRPAKSAAAHLLARTWRVDRHGPKPITPGATAAATHPVPPIPAPVITGLEERGLAFVLACWAGFDEWTAADVVLLREAALLVDALESYRAQLAADGYLVQGARGAKYPHPLLRAQAQARTALVGILAALNLDDDLDDE